MSRKQFEYIKQMSILSLTREKIISVIEQEPVKDFDPSFLRIQLPTKARSIQKTSEQTKKQRVSLKESTQNFIPAVDFASIGDRMLNTIKDLPVEDFQLPSHFQMKNIKKQECVRNRLSSVSSNSTYTSKEVTITKHSHKRRKLIDTSLESSIKKDSKQPIYKKQRRNAFEYEKYRHSPNDFFNLPKSMRKNIINRAFHKNDKRRGIECFACLERFYQTTSLNLHIEVCNKFKKCSNQLNFNRLRIDEDSDDENEQLYKPQYYHNLIRHGVDDDIWRHYLQLMSCPAYYFYLPEEMAIDICRTVVPIYRKIRKSQYAQTPCLLYTRCNQAFTSPTTLHHHMIGCFAKNAPDLKNEMSHYSSTDLDTKNDVSKTQEDQVNYVIEKIQETESGIDTDEDYYYDDEIFQPSPKKIQIHHSSVESDSAVDCAGGEGKSLNSYDDRSPSLLTEK